MLSSIGIARTIAASLVAAVTVSFTFPTGVASGQPELVAPPDFVALHDIDPTILQDIRYFTAHNFTGNPVDGYRAPTCILTRDAAQGLKRAQQQLVERGYTLKVYDCYRPQRTVSDFIAWVQDVGDKRMKTEFYPHIDKSTLIRDGYIADRSGHSRGSTMDLTLVRLPVVPTRTYVPGEPLIDCTAPASARFPDNSIDMGTGFDCFDTLAHTLDPRIQDEQLKNRLLLKEVLQSEGFVNYENEWWHFTHQPEHYPDTYFDFPVE
jgi:zinc D-Ala-D-Ala dipeptidase